MLWKSQVTSVQRRVVWIQSSPCCLRDQRGHRERERDGEADIAEVEHRRMDHHRPVLQQRIEAVAVADIDDALALARAPRTG